ncbi:hypothetical protein ACLOJK_041574 [Asimina triloba]
MCRAEYDPNQYLWEEEFTLAGKGYRRQDLEASTMNACQVILLPSNITVFALDFSGSGLSDGDYVSLGWHENPSFTRVIYVLGGLMSFLYICQKDDLKTVVTFLRSNPKISLIGLWGRSMGAVTSLLYGAEDPSIAGMVLDSAFSNLFDLMMELADVYKIRLPKFTNLFKIVKMGVQYMRRVIQKRAKFDIMDLNCLQVAPRTYIPALFAHAADDVFIQPHHSDRIYQCYAGDKNIIKFKGDHNSHRPQFYYDSVSIFFYNVLQPPKLSSASSIIEKFCHTGGLKDAGAMNMSSASSVIEKFCHAGSLKDAGAMNMDGVYDEKYVYNECCKFIIGSSLLIRSELLSEMGDSAEAMLKNAVLIQVQMERIGEDALLLVK